MERLIIHYNDGIKKEDLSFDVKTPHEALVIIMTELAPEKLWAKGWDKKY